jgi:sugar lactone lactonase YvrE
MKTITKLIYTAFAVVTLTIGAVTAQGAVNDLFISINGDGSNGGGSIFEYTPTGVQSLFASELSEPRGMAFDQFGNLFVANTTFDEPSQTFQASIVKITPDGVQSTFATFDGNLFGEGVVFDRAGNLFVGVTDGNAPPGPSTIYKFTPDGTQSMFGSFPGWSIGNLVFDSLGNLFAADAWFQLIHKFAPDGTRSVFIDSSAFEPFTGPVGLAFDRFGNLFTSTQAATPAGTDTILKFTPNGVETTFATDLDWPRGLAFDRRGNLFVAERGAFAPPGDVLKFTPDGNRTVFAPDLDDPQFLVFQPATPRPRPTPHPRPTSPL